MSLLRRLFFYATLGFLASGFLALAMTGTARAALVFCNHTQGMIEAALGYRDTGDWVSEGWWRIEPGQCAHVFSRPLTRHSYFYYAYALTSLVRDKSPFIWVGKYQFCTDAKAFKVEGSDDCESKGYQTKGFREIELGSNVHDYTLDFQDGSDGK